MDKFWKIAGIGILISLFLSLGHLFFGVALTDAGTNVLLLDGYVFYLSFVFLLLLSVTYLMIFKDISESIGIFVVGAYGLLMGLVDFFVYLFLGFPETSYPWLITNNSPAALMSQLFGMNTVTIWSLSLNIVVFGIVTYFVVKFLLKFEAKLGKIEF